MDIVMPVLDGIKATKKIMELLRLERALKGTFDTSNDLADPASMAAEMGLAVAAVTAFVDKSTVDKVFAAGMVQAVQKPVQNSQLKKLIKKYHPQPME